jgi:hypothetical protein
VTTPFHASSPHPAECADGLHGLTHRLRHELGVTITHHPDVPADDIGWWESATNTVTVRADTTIEQQTWLLLQVWQHLVLDPAATTGHVETLSRRLHLVST